MPLPEIIQNIDPVEQKRLLRRLISLALKATKMSKGGFSPAERHELGHDLSEIALGLLADVAD